MNDFTNELLRFFRGREEFYNASYLGRACYVPLDDGLRLKISFSDQGYADHYSALHLQVINNESVVDNLTMTFRDYFSKTPNAHMWTYNNKTEWYGNVPSSSEVSGMVDDICEYIRLYNQSFDQSEGMEMC